MLEVVYHGRGNAYQPLIRTNAVASLSWLDNGKGPINMRIRCLKELDSLKDVNGGVVNGREQENGGVEIKVVVWECSYL